MVPDTLEENDWQLLLSRIKSGKCTPFLGAGACGPTLPLASEIAQEWAKKHAYPLDDGYDLARVAQYLAVSHDSLFPKEDICERFKAASSPDFQEADEPHAVLANLPLPLYLTTNYDDFLMRALIANQKDPRREICRWNGIVQREISVFDSQFDPTPKTPVVFHLHGHAGIPESLVLTEDDYLDFLVNTSRDEGLIPLRIQRALTGTSLLFLGYRIADWDFRVLFRSLVSSLANNLARSHISVQISPGDGKLSKARQKQAKHYLDRYFSELRIHVYWGTVREFARDLADRWKNLGHGA